MKFLSKALIVFSFSVLSIQQTTECFFWQKEEDKIFDTICVKNKTKEKIYVATYYKKNFMGFSCKKYSDIYQMEPLSKITIDRPPRSSCYGRRIVFTKNPEKFKESFNSKEYKSIGHTPIGLLKGSTFYIAERHKVLIGFNSLRWHLVKPILDFFLEQTDSLVEQIIKIASKHKYIDKNATVRTNDNLCDQEKIFIKKRKSTTKNSIEKLTSMQFASNNSPTIAMCFSGGGFRAMIGTMGSMLAAKDVGLLDSTTYMSALSGSTWMIAPWLTMKTDLKKYSAILRNKVSKDIKKELFKVDKILEAVIKKVVFGQELSLVDIYGAVLAEKLLSEFKEKIHEIGLSQSSEITSKGTLPLPIYTAVEATQNYKWFEFTPFEIGSSKIKSYVPTWAFGRRFMNGKSLNYAPEQSLGYLMGIWGSAFTADFHRIVDEIKTRLLKRDIFDLLHFTMDELQIGDNRISPAQALNFAYKIPNNITNNMEELTLVDGGMDFNLPFPPLLRQNRKVDVIIAFDYSSGIEDSTILKKAEFHAIRNNLKFPIINTENYMQKNISVFKGSKSSGTPTVIYLPLIKNEKFSKNFDPQNASYCSTFNFEYTNRQYDELSGLTKFNMNQNKEIIAQAIREHMSS